jgi:O-6-methylguanine DNA methyltransferase
MTMECCIVCEPAPGVVLQVAASELGVCGVWIGRAPRECAAESGKAFLSAAVRQLREYFDGARREFDLPLDLRGTRFQLQVWRAVTKIPYGETRTYAQIASQIGNPKATRAVGGANGRNPAPIIVPCHRVVATGGGLGGYSAGLDFKSRLLALEKGTDAFRPRPRGIAPG